MSRQRTIHLSAQALKAIRPNDGLSPRINQIIERYQALLDASRDKTDAQLAILIEDMLEADEASAGIAPQDQH